MDASGNLYQYDNYDEVAMDTDSETSSPGECVRVHTHTHTHTHTHLLKLAVCCCVSVPSPTHTQLTADDPGCFPQVSLFVTESHHFGMVRIPKHCTQKMIHFFVSSDVFTIRASTSSKYPLRGNDLPS